MTSKIVFEAHFILMCFAAIWVTFLCS